MFALSLLGHAGLAMVAMPALHGRIGPGSRPDTRASLAGVGGRYAVDVDCLSAAVIRDLAGQLGCVVWPRSAIASCSAREHSALRVAAVSCREVESVDLAELNLDATELIDEDSLDLEMMPFEQLATVQPAPEEDPAADGQVVEVARPLTEQRPAESELLAEFDVTADKQTVHHGDPSKGVAGPAPAPERATEIAEAEPVLPFDRGATAGPRSSSPAQPATGGGAMSMRAPGAVGDVQRREGELSESARVTDGLGLALGVVRATDALRGEGGGGGDPLDTSGPLGSGPGSGGGDAAAAAGERVPDLRPQVQHFAAGSGGSNDYLPDVEEGEFTALNARKWKYASFFNRVKRQVSQNWNPQRVYARRDPNGNVYGFKERVTVLQVSLDPDGSLREVVIAEPCGGGLFGRRGRQVVPTRPAVPEPAGRPGRQFVQADHVPLRLRLRRGPRLGLARVSLRSVSARGIIALRSPARSSGQGRGDSARERAESRVAAATPARPRRPRRRPRPSAIRPGSGRSSRCAKIQPSS